MLWESRLKLVFSHSFITVMFEKEKKKEREKVGETKVNTKREMLTCVAQNVYIRQSSACSSTMALKSRCHSSCTRLKHRDHYVQNE